MGPLPTVAVPGRRLKWEWHLCAAGAGSPLLTPLHIQAHTCSVSSAGVGVQPTPWVLLPSGRDGPSRNICSQCLLPFVLWGVLSLEGA